MYGFNGHDHRLERMMESTLMVMEALEGFGDRIKYDVSGHSGEDNNIHFLSHLRPPENNNERLKAGDILHNTSNENRPKLAKKLNSLFLKL